MSKLEEELINLVTTIKYGDCSVADGVFWIEKVLVKQRGELIERIIEELERPFVQKRGIDEKNSILNYMNSLKSQEKGKHE